MPNIVNHNSFTVISPAVCKIQLISWCETHPLKSAGGRQRRVYRCANGSGDKTSDFLLEYVGLNQSPLSHIKQSLGKKLGIPSNNFVVYL